MYCESRFMSFRWHQVFCQSCVGLLVIVVLGLDASAKIDPDVDYKSIPIYAGMDTREPPGLETLKDDPKAYKEAKTALSNKKKMRNENRSKVLGILSNNSEVGLTGQEALFDAWFESVVFAEMTQTDRESLLALPSLRERFFLDYFERPAKVTPTEVRDRLLKLTRDRMWAIADDNFHPAVRVNAMLIIGRLNYREGVSIGANKSPPLPWSVKDKALGDLMNAAYKDPDQIEEVRIAAMVGLLRHAEMDGQRPVDRRNLKTEDRNEIITEMVKLLKSDPPANRTPEGHAWMQRRAMDIIGGFRDRGPGNIGLNELERIMADESRPSSYRCTAASAYGRINYPSLAEAAPSDRVKRLAKLASSVCKAELDRLQAEVDKHEAKIAEKFGKLDGGGRDPRLGPAARLRTTVPLDPFKVTSSRRLFKYYLSSIHKSVGTDERSGYRRYSQAEPHKTFTTDVHNALTRLVNATDKPKGQESPLTAEALMTQVGANLSRLEELIADAEPAPAAAAPPAAPKVGAPGDPSVPAAPAVPPPAP